MGRAVTCHDVPQWLIDTPTETWPTEILVSLSTKVGPMWKHGDGERGYWYGAVVVDLPGLDVASLWECDHDHTDKEDARDCADDAALQIAEAVIEARRLP